MITAKNELVLWRTVNFVNIQSETCGTKTDKQNKKVLCIHCFVECKMTGRDSSALCFFDYRQICRLCKHENDSGSQNRGDCDEGEDRA